MTTNTLAAIRERADEIATGKWIYDDALAQIASGKEDQYGSRALEVALFESSSPKYIDMLITNTQALLAIVDALTARAEAAEAALEGANRREQWLSAALRSIYWEAYDATNKEIPMRKSVKYSLVHAKAALNGIGIDLDALAAHDANGESAGNGGA